LANYHGCSAGKPDYADSTARKATVRSYGNLDFIAFHVREKWAHSTGIGVFAGQWFLSAFRKGGRAAIGMPGISFTDDDDSVSGVDNVATAAG
jgi:hypothetical protein